MHSLVKIFLSFMRNSKRLKTIAENLRSDGKNTETCQKNIGKYSPFSHRCFKTYIEIPRIFF